MKIIKVDLKNPKKDTIGLAANVLKKGGLLVYPTDTAYGLGANALDEKAIQSLYRVKERYANKPTHTVVKNWKMITDLTKPNKYAKILFDKFLPGPLTIILTKRKIVPDVLTGGLPTLGVRIPDNPITKSLSLLLPFPYTTPSANRSGGNTPYSINQVKKELDISKIDLILDAGTLPSSLPSTLIDTSQSPFKILREGPISAQDINNALK